MRMDFIVFHWFSLHFGVPSIEIHCFSLVFLAFRRSSSRVTLAEPKVQSAKYKMLTLTPDILIYGSFSFVAGTLN